MASNINLNNVVLTNPDNNFNPYNDETPLPVQISGNTTEQYTDQVKIGSVAARSMYASDTAPILDDNARPGWSFVKSATGHSWMNLSTGNLWTQSTGSTDNFDEVDLGDVAKYRRVQATPGTFINWWVPTTDVDWEIFNTKPVLGDTPGATATIDLVTGVIVINGGGQVFTPSQVPTILAAAEKINWFYYGPGNTYTTFGNVKSLSSLITIDVYNNRQNLPFFVVYTKPTGVNDYSWYKSSILYQLNPGENIQLGEGIQAWSGIRPKKQSNLRQVEFNIKSIHTLGNNVDIEELYSIAIHTDSASANTRLLVRQLGFDLQYGQNKIERRINLI
tara:strand:- start:890 stop:1888 length:999 start_codon:yes stop_codon:yes gene_type:complete